MTATQTWQRLLDAHPLGEQSEEPEFWEGYLGDNPDVLHRLLADIYQATYGSEKPPTLDALWEMMSTPQFSTQPFGEAVLDLLGDRSVRWLAQQLGGVSHTHLARHLNGSRPIVSVHDHRGSMRRIESIARVLRVHPSFFVEYRRLWIMSLIDSAFTAEPTLSVGVFRRFSGFEKKGA